MIEKVIDTDWRNLLKEEFEKSYFAELEAFLQKEYEEQIIYPQKEEIFNALRYTPCKAVKAVILGQDPYHGPGQAHGLSFSVKPDVRIPPSLKNIYKELHEDLGCEIPGHGHLTSWAKQGVLLLNTVLTVRKGQANSHRGKGWEILTDQIIRTLNDREDPVVFILWGKPAQAKMNLIDTKKHFIITSPHPSPLSANKGFFGSRPFSKTNSYLLQAGIKQVDWSLPQL
ncbi:uracil-DNA glycosylase [Peribacillus kribbensis]|uniref:uracil-DNA glycosylase n=1 Tax=Peribacillus kribbensis TaxID=356658 RepID=UPI00041519A1|nr:uracil-DNA glycosylase [Peribacillus kribbensis]